MKRSAEAQRTRSGAALLGVRREAQRHAAFVRAGRVECSLRCVRAKAVSPLRSATAVQDAPCRQRPETAQAFFSFPGANLAAPAPQTMVNLSSLKNKFRA